MYVTKVIPYGCTISDKLVNSANRYDEYVSSVISIVHSLYYMLNQTSGTQILLLSFHADDTQQTDRLYIFIHILISHIKYLVPRCKLLLKSYIHSGHDVGVYIYARPVAALY